MARGKDGVFALTFIPVKAIKEQLRSCGHHLIVTTDAQHRTPKRGHCLTYWSIHTRPNQRRSTCEDIRTGQPTNRVEGGAGKWRDSRELAGERSGGGATRRVRGGLRLLVLGGRRTRVRWRRSRGRCDVGGRVVIVRGRGRRRRRRRRRGGRGGIGRMVLETAFLSRRPSLRHQLPTQQRARPHRHRSSCTGEIVWVQSEPRSAKDGH